MNPVNCSPQALHATSRLGVFLLYRHQVGAHAPHPSRPLTPVEGSEATRPSSRLLLRLLQSLNSPARKSRRKRGETRRRRFALGQKLLPSAVLLFRVPVISGVSIALLQSRVGGWIKNWLWKGKNEAHLPADDKPSVSSSCIPFGFLCIWFSATQTCGTD